MRHLFVQLTRHFVVSVVVRVASVADLIVIEHSTIVVHVDLLLVSAEQAEAIYDVVLVQLELLEDFGEHCGQRFYYVGADLALRTLGIDWRRDDHVQSLTIRQDNLQLLGHADIVDLERVQTFPVARLAVVRTE